MGVKSNTTRVKKKLKSKVKKDFIVWGSILVLSLVAFFIFELLLMPQIKLKGQSSIVINYKEKYKEKGYEASFLGDDISKDVEVDGKVNSNKLGTYRIVYTVKAGVFKRKVVRKVTVEDTAEPEITLVSMDDIYVCPGKEYQEEEYKATDNYDGDITKKVKVKKEEDKITYTVSDKAGNEKSVSRKIIYKDNVKPEIKLEGSETVYIFVGDNYNEPGYTVNDNCDGDISKNVKVEGKVDSNAIGDYTLKYSVTDKEGNEASVERKVVVSEKSKNGAVYLTFDDGPKQGTTNVILDILKEEGVKATFFVTNGGPDELIKRIYDEGHTVALHTASHNYSIVYASVDAYFNDLYTVQDRVKRITGYEAKIIRFPGGSSNTVSRKYQVGIMSTLTKEVVNRGFRYFDWNVSSGDAEPGSHTASEIANNVINSISKNRANVVLMHDIKTYTRDALRDIIHYGKNNGFHFEKITMGTEMVTQRVNN